MKRHILAVLSWAFISADLFAQQSQNSISVQGRLSSTGVISGVQVEIFANEVLASTASPIDLVPDQNGVFTTYITGFDSSVFKIPAGLFEISFKKGEIEIAKTPLTTVAFALAVRGIKAGDNILGASGNVGIGTVEPEKKLAVVGDVLIDGDLYARNLVGAVMFFAGSTCPTGWLLANGASLPTTGPYAALFNYLQYRYGGSGSNFVLPNMVDGAFIRGTGGNAATLGVKQVDTFKAHSHSYLQRPNNAVRDSGSRGVTSEYSIWTNTGETGGNETRPLNYAMTPCIKY